MNQFFNATFASLLVSFILHQLSYKGIILDCKHECHVTSLPNVEHLPQSNAKC
jgi:hypothetical protein